MEHVVRGQLNKQIAAELGIGEHSIKIHRSRVMEKMEVESLARPGPCRHTVGVGRK